MTKITMSQGSQAASYDLDGVDKPIMEFRGWMLEQLDRERSVLKVDLFWPIKEKDMKDAEEINEDGDQKGNFPFKDLKPLTTFRNLHVLELHGMMRSYQPIIWETCWLNDKLTKVTLAMALEPEFNDGKSFPSHPHFHLITVLGLLTTQKTSRASTRRSPQTGSTTAASHATRNPPSTWALTPAASCTLNLALASISTAMP
jgi:hypothetical protein